MFPEFRLISSLGHKSRMESEHTTHSSLGEAIRFTLQLMGSS